MFKLKGKIWKQKSKKEERQTTSGNSGVFFFAGVFFSFGEKRVGRGQRLT